MTGLRIEHRVLRGLLVTLGIAAVGIGGTIFLRGASLLWVTEALFDRVTGQTHPPDPAAIAATIDNEFRFYAVFWLSYGVVLLWVARDIAARLRHVPILIGLFFLGGIGRVLSVLFVGAPHPAFVGLMVIELVLPVIVLLLYARVRTP